MSKVHRVVAIGDSVIYGRLDAEGGGWVGRLRRHVEMLSGEGAVFNLGIGGDGVREVRRRLVEVAPRNPNTVVLGVGLNDCRRKADSDDLSAGEFRDELIGILRDLSELPTVERLWVCSMNPIDPSDNFKGFSYAIDDWREFNSAIRDASSAVGCSVVDFSTLVDFSSASGCLADHIHPSTKGHVRMYDHAREVLLEE